MNNVNLIGRFTRDPEFKRTPSGTTVTNGNIAVARNFKNAKGEYEADFINIVAWRNTAVLIAKYFKKGDMIGITGRIQTRNYEKDGRKVYVTEVVAENISFIQNKKKDKASTEDPFEGEAIEIDDSDLPF